MLGWTWRQRVMSRSSIQTLMPQNWLRVRTHTCRILFTKLRQKIEADGRWIAEIVDVPGVMAYGATEKEAVASGASPCAPHPSRPHRTTERTHRNCYRLYRSCLNVGQWPSTKAARVFRALLRSGYAIKSQKRFTRHSDAPERAITFGRFMMGWNWAEDAGANCKAYGNKA